MLSVLLSSFLCVCIPLQMMALQSISAASHLNRDPDYPAPFNLPPLCLFLALPFNPRASVENPPPFAPGRTNPPPGASQNWHFRQWHIAAHRGTTRRFVANFSSYNVAAV